VQSLVLPSLSHLLHPYYTCPLPYTCIHLFSKASIIRSCILGKNACAAIRCNGLANENERSIVSIVGPSGRSGEAAGGVLAGGDADGVVNGVVVRCGEVDDAGWKDPGTPVVR
jgi:hypothetical protein